MLQIKVPGIQAPHDHIPQQVLYGESYPFPEPLVYSFIHISQSPVKELSDKAGGKHMFTIQKMPHEDGMLTHNGDVTWLSKGIIYNTAITTPVPCIL